MVRALSVAADLGMFPIVAAAMRRFIPLLVLFLLALSGAGHAAPKVLLVGIDGVQYQRARELNLPVLFSLHTTRAYTGGVTGLSSQADTLSGPGWTTVLTGVWADKHGVTSNTSGAANREFPSLFRRLRQARPEAYIASLASWAPINERFLAHDVAGNDLNLAGRSDAETLAAAVDVLRHAPVDLLFVHLSAPDNVGHSQCFGAAYDRALVQADRALGTLLAEVRARAPQGEDWLVLVTTDHGREPPRGCHHSAQTRQEKEIFIASNQPMNAEFGQHLPAPDPQLDGLYGHASQASIAPTVLRHLGLAPGADALFDGIPLVGPLGVRKLMGDPAGAGILRWAGAGDRPVSIARGGVPVAQVRLGANGWVDPAPLPGINDYTLTLDDTAVSLRSVNRQLRVAVDWTPATAYFFYDTAEYARYDLQHDRTAEGTPTAVNDHNWPGLRHWAPQLRGGFSKDPQVAYFFLDDGTYLRYDKQADRVSPGYPRPVDDHTWPGLGPYARQIRTAVRWTGTKAFIFLDDGRYLRFDLDRDRVDPGYPQPVTEASWPGLSAHAGEIETVFRWDDQRAYFFLSGDRYLRYDIANDRVDGGPRPVTASTWPGLLRP